MILADELPMKTIGKARNATARHEAWIRSHERMSITVLVMSLVSAISIAMSIWSITSKPSPVYFATREDGGILPLVPVSIPFLSDGTVTNFAVEAVTHALTLDFANWRDDLTDAAGYFEHPDGWNGFLDAIDGSGMLSYIRDHRLVSTVVANGATVVGSGLDARNRHSWNVQMPLSITYESASEISRESLLADVIVSRLPTWETSDAIGVSQIIIRPGRTETVH